MSPHLDLRDRTALVTGAASGIGLAVARDLRARGADVFLLDVDATTVTARARELRGRSITADVRDAEAVAAAVAAMPAFDIVVANAGVTPRPATVRTGDPADFQRVLDVNLNGVLNTVRPTLDDLVARRGHLVIVASVAAFTPTPGGAAYNVSKAAVEALGRCLRLELAAHAVTVQIAAFGVVDTAMTHATLDGDPTGQALEQLLPRLLRRRLSPEQAAARLVDGIERRATRTLAPQTWLPYALLRGIADIALDSLTVRDRRLHRLVLHLEAARNDRDDSARP